VAEHGKGSIVRGTVSSVDAKGAVVQLSDGGEVEGYLRTSELSRERIEDARSVLNEGEEVEAKIMTIDRKNRKISLSVKAKDMQEESEAVEEYTRKSGGATTTLGDMLKEKLGSGDDEQES
jgi:small subunit ribosomal protein S1